MSTTNTDGEGGAPYEGADLTLVGLLKKDLALDLFIKAWRFEIDRRLSESVNIPQAAVDFQPAHVWRRDGPYWMAVRIFVSDRQGNVGILFSKGERAKLRFMTRDTDGGMVATISEASDPPLAEDLMLAGRLSQAVSEGAEVGVQSYVRLWNGRIYDSQMMAKVRQLSAAGTARFDGLLVLEARPLLSPRDAVGKDADKILDAKTSTAIEGDETPTAHYIKTIRYPAARWSAFIPDLKNIVREIAADVDRDSKKKPAVYISFDLEKRRLINQVELLRSAIPLLLQHYGDFTFLVNGMTGPEGGGGENFYKDIHAEERSMIAKVLLDDTNIEVVDMFGWSMRDKTQAIALADFYIAPSGNAALIPMALDLPGVFFASPEAMQNLGAFRYMSNRSTLIGREFVTSSADDFAMRKVAFGHDDGTRISYSIARDGFLAAVSAALGSATGVQP